jgi:hypothetical protein
MACSSALSGVFASRVNVVVFSVVRLLMAFDLQANDLTLLRLIINKAT